MSDAPQQGVHVQLVDRITADVFPDATAADHDSDGYLRLTDGQGRTMLVVAPREWQWYRIVRAASPEQSASTGQVLRFPADRTA